MNFFQAQDRARRNSVLLFFLFAAAVASLAILVYLAAALALRPEGVRAGEMPEFNPDLFLKTTAAVLAVVAFGSLTKTLALAAGGGAAVAKAMGGRLVPPATRDPLERRLINVVEEMAIASGVPAPQAYLLPDPAINAFAAGTRPDNAVVGMTRGALETLSRDELQGVVAHEFSHILNGDMRLNLRLIGILHGVLLIGYIGYFILRSSLYGGMMRSRDGRGGAAAALPLIGLALVIVGFAGSFFGNWIRAAVSRQREFLADASAVQFTRNPRGIGGALEKIGALSGQLSSPRAGECRHMCFADSVASGFANPFATHPPLGARIRRIFPQWDGKETIGLYDAKTKIRMAKMSEAAAGDGAVSAFSGAESAPPAGLRETRETESAPAPATEAAESASSGGGPPDLFGMLFGDGAADEAANQAAARVGELSPDSRAFASNVRRAVPEMYWEAAHEPHSARCLLYAMLLDERDAECRRAQLQVLAERGDAGVYDETLRLAKGLGGADGPPRRARLPLAAAAAPALRMLSPRQHRLFAANMDALTAADGAIELFEWCLQAVTLRHLADAFGAKPPGATTLRKSRTECAYALSILSRAGHPESGAEMRAAFSEAATLLPEEGGKWRFDDGDFHPGRLLEATRTLAGLGPGEKERFIRACAFCAGRDGKISRNERDLLTVFAALLDCPMPPV